MTDANPDMRLLREGLARMGIPYEAEDADDDVYGLATHLERTWLTMPDGRRAYVMYAWSRDEDGDKRFESDGGRFGYLEMQVDGEGRRAVTAEEALEAVVA